jgi:hypothetical protein
MSHEAAAHLHKLLGTIGFCSSSAIPADADFPPPQASLALGKTAPFHALNHLTWRKGKYYGKDYEGSSSS